MINRYLSIFNFLPTNKIEKLFDAFKIKILCNFKIIKKKNSGHFRTNIKLDLELFIFHLTINPDAIWK